MSLEQKISQTLSQTPTFLSKLRNSLARRLMPYLAVSTLALAGCGPGKKELPSAASSSQSCQDDYGCSGEEVCINNTCQQEYKCKEGRIYVNGECVFPPDSGSSHNNNQPTCLDEDNDRFYSTNSCNTKIDCDDDDSTIYPDAEEICDYKDNNCDGQTDEDVLTTYYQDNDGDDFGDSAYSHQNCLPPEGYVTKKDDCDDNNPNIYPIRRENCNGIDDNCNGETDEHLGGCCDGRPLSGNQVCYNNRPCNPNYNLECGVDDCGVDHGNCNRRGYGCVEGTCVFCAGEERWVDMGDGTVKDCETGLFWPNHDGQLCYDGCRPQPLDACCSDWQTAWTICEIFELAGYTDWHLPTKEQLEGLVKNERVNGCYWDPIFRAPCSCYFSHEGGPSFCDDNNAWETCFDTGETHRVSGGEREASGGTLCVRP